MAIAACGLALLLSTAPTTHAADHDAQLIVFVQHDPSPLGQAFETQTLPQIRALARDMDVTLLERRISRQGSAPVGVDITPLIVFQNHRGRSVYQGRYSTLDRIRNFVRTSRHLPQGDEPLVREDLPVWELDSAEGPKVATPIKITAMTGTHEEVARVHASQQIFLDEWTQIIGVQRDRFEMRDRVELGRTDRLFYTDYHPHLADGGEFYLSLALYSQFNCHDPIFSLPGEELHGPWHHHGDIFYEGARILENEIARQLAESTLGDGFDVVPATVQRVSWEEAGLPLPPPPPPDSADTEVPADLELVREWVIDQDVQGDRPAVQFAFPAPLDGYAGEVTHITGDLTLGPDLSLTDMRGTFHADPGSVTMGESDLDAAIHGSMLEVDAYPDAHFVIDSVESSFDRPAFGQVAAAVLHGRFTMKDRTVPLSVPISIEAYLGRDGEPRLSIDGQWSIRLLEPFGIAGPPGDAPANDTLIYRCHLVFQPK